MRNKLLIILCLALMASCSSIRKPVQAEAEQRAARMLQSAQRQEADSPEEALLAYQSAFQQYRSFAGIEGELWALAGIARIHHQKDAMAEYQRARLEMDEIIKLIAPKYNYIPMLVDLQLLQRAADWQGMAAQAVVKDAYPTNIKMRILSYRLQAKAYLRQRDPATTSALTKLYHKALRGVHRKGAMHALETARAGYALAYHHYSWAAYDTATKYAHQTAELDRLYGNHIGLGYDLWLQAQCAMQLDKREEALALLLKAQRIFDAIGSGERPSNLEADIQALSIGG